MDPEVEENEDEAADEMHHNIQVEPEAEVDPCANHKCQRGGKCIAGRGGDYTCRCKAPFKGKYCETGEDPCEY